MKNTLSDGRRFCHPPSACSAPENLSQNACVENELVGIFNYLIVVVGHEDSFRVRDYVINMPPDNLDRVGGNVHLMELLFICEPFGIFDYRLDLIEVGGQIQISGYAVAKVRPVEDTGEVVLNGGHKLLA